MTSGTSFGARHTIRYRVAYFEDRGARQPAPAVDALSAHAHRATVSLVMVTVVAHFGTYCAPHKVHDDTLQKCLNPALRSAQNHSRPGGGNAPFSALWLLRVHVAPALVVASNRRCRCCRFPRHRATPERGDWRHGTRAWVAVYGYKKIFAAWERSP